MSWSYKVTLLYCSFVALMATLVVLCVRQNFDLVRPDYYEAEVVYGDHIKAQENALNLPEGLRFEFAADSLELALVFPESQEAIQGKVLFYRPSDAGQDKQFDIVLEEGKMPLSLSDFSTGKWVIQVSWKAGQDHYYQEQDWIQRNS